VATNNHRFTVMFPLHVLILWPEHADDLGKVYCSSVPVPEETVGRLPSYTFENVIPEDGDPVTDRTMWWRFNKRYYRTAASLISAIDSKAKEDWRLCNALGVVRG